MDNSFQNKKQWITVRESVREREIWLTSSQKEDQHSNLMFSRLSTSLKLDL